VVGLNETVGYSRFVGRIVRGRTSSGRIKRGSGKISIVTITIGKNWHTLDDVTYVGKNAKSCSKGLMGLTCFSICYTLSQSVVRCNIFILSIRLLRSESHIIST